MLELLGCPSDNLTKVFRSKGSRSYERNDNALTSKVFLRLSLSSCIATGTKSVSLFELLSACNRANFRLKRLPTVEENSYVHWLGSCISFTSTSSNLTQKAQRFLITTLRILMS